MNRQYMVSILREEMLTTAYKLGTELQELPLPESNSLWERLRAKFTPLGKRGSFLWEYLESRSVIQTDDPWEWIAEFVVGKPTYVFFDEETLAFNAKDGAHIASILKECLWADDDFYLTDADLSYILCFNHHDFLIACGQAEIWLAEKIADRK